jgi:hypothetical protein
MKLPALMDTLVPAVSDWSVTGVMRSLLLGLPHDTPMTRL